MTKLVALITDIHVGCRNNAQQFHNQFGRFFQEIFFPVLEARGITDVINAGDTFDKQTNIDFVSLYKSKEYLFDPLKEKQIYMEAIIGNHDRYYKSTNLVNSPDLLLREYDNIRTFANSTESVRYPGICYIPWINRENAEQTLKTVKLSKSPCAIGHLELAGFQQNQFGSADSQGLDAKFFSKFDKVYTGHYHHRSKRGNVEYVGAATEQTWADVGDWRGFHIIDLDTFKIVESIQNTFTVFEKITVNNDKHLPIVEDVKDKFIRIEVAADVDPKIVAKLKQAAASNGAAQVDIEDQAVIEQDAAFETSTDILTLMDRYVKAHIDDQDKAIRVYDRMKGWYEKALQEE